MGILNNIDFLKKLDKDYKINNEYVEISKRLCDLEIKKVSFKKQSFDKTITIII